MSQTEEKTAVVFLRKPWPGLSLKGGREREIWEHQGLSGELCRISFFNIKLLFHPFKAQNYREQSLPQLKWFIPNNFTVELFIQFRRRISIQAWEVWPFQSKSHAKGCTASESFSLRSIWQIHWCLKKIFPWFIWTHLNLKSESDGNILFKTDMSKAQLQPSWII